jgi:hypothetical protein
MNDDQYISVRALLGHIEFLTKALDQAVEIGQIEGDPNNAGAVLARGSTYPAVQLAVHLRRNEPAPTQRLEAAEESQ